MLRLYGWLIRLSPGAVRREYGAAMEETFARRWNDARATGFWTSVRMCGRESVGMIGWLLSERCAAPARLRWQRQHMQPGVKAGRMDAVAREVRHAARRLVRSRAFTLAAVLTLALALGANAAIFTVVYLVVLNPLPYAHSDRLIALDYGLPNKP
jgi:hypothetical protein